MIDLYGMSSPNVRKILIALEEMDLRFNAIHVPVFRAAQFNPEFLALNPLAKVPVLVDHDTLGPACPLIESGAILIHLAENYGTGLLPQSGRDRAETIKWLMVQVANIGPYFGQHSHFRSRWQEEPYAATRYRQIAAQLYRILEQRLAVVPFLAGDKYSIADIATWPWARYLRRHGLNPVEFPSIAAWAERIATRPAVRRADVVLARFARQDSDDRANASEEEMDRFFWRHVDAPGGMEAASGTVRS